MSEPGATELDRFLSLLRRVFAEHAVEHMVVGSMAATWLGHARSTKDVDVVIATTGEQSVALARAMSDAGLYIDELSVLDAWRRRSMANAIDPETGWKVDLIMLDDRPFSRAEFGRRFDHATAVGTFSTQTAEDLILSKLHWAQQSESERQIRDVNAVFDIWRSRLDAEYLRRWADEIGVRDLVDELFARPQ